MSPAARVYLCCHFWRFGLMRRLAPKVDMQVRVLISRTSGKPNLNAYAERFVRSIKSECLAEIIPLGGRHLRHAVKEYTQHYHVERNHQGLDNRLIEEQQGVVDPNSAVARHERLGGVLNYYERRAA